MGTTLTAAALVDSGDGESLVVVNVGDSRAYLLRDGELSRVTDDHSVSEELVRSGQLSEAEAATDNRRHVLTRVLGMDSEVSVDRFDLDPFRGDRLLLGDRRAVQRGTRQRDRLRAAPDRGSRRGRP